MDKAILLAAAASLCTAASSVCQRRGQEPPDGGLRRPPGPPAGLAAGHRQHDPRVRLPADRATLWRPRVGPVDPGGGAASRLRLPGHRRVAEVKRRDWLAAAARSAGIGVFLRLASPSAGRLHALGSSWLLAALVTRRDAAAAAREGISQPYPAAIALLRAAEAALTARTATGDTAATARRRSNRGSAPSCSSPPRPPACTCRNILAKLGVTSRGEAAAATHRLRLLDPTPEPFQQLVMILCREPQIGPEAPRLVADLNDLCVAARATGITPSRSYSALYG